MRAAVRARDHGRPVGLDAAEEQEVPRGVGAPGLVRGVRPRVGVLRDQRDEVVRDPVLSGLQDLVDVTQDLGELSSAKSVEVVEPRPRRVEAKTAAVAAAPAPSTISFCAEMSVSTASSRARSSTRTNSSTSSRT